jgi:Flp pilus assembly protein TadG
MHPRFTTTVDRRGEAGMTLVYVAVLGLLLVGILGLAIDSAYVMTTHQQLQQASDAAALAAVQVVKGEADPFDASNPYPLTRQAAIDIALSNEAASLPVKVDVNAGNDPVGDIVVGIWDADTQTFTPDVLTPNAVRVRAKRTADRPDGPLSLLFGSIFGSATSDVGVASTAVMAAAADPLVLVLEPVQANSLRINGTNALNVLKGKIHANSANACGISLVGTPYMAALQTSVVGGACYPPDTVFGPVVENADYVPDPLAHLLPDIPSWNAFKASLPEPLGPNGKIDGPGTYSPGHYPRGIDLQSTDVANLLPGYYMLGQGIKTSGSGFIQGDGVTLFVDQGGEVNITGDGSGMRITPPPKGDPFHGVSMFLHRNINKDAACKITGGGLFKVEGVIYVPSGELVMGGTPGKEIGAIVIDRASTQGTTSYFITGKGLPTPKGPEYPFLVE